MQSELRKDYIQEKYVIIAPRRGKRRHEYPVCAPTPPTECLFCPGNIKKSETIKLIHGSHKPWDIAVLKNKFPVMSPTNPKAYGVQELLIETPNHTKQLEEMPAHHIARLLELYAERTKVIRKNPKIQYVLMFKNNGGSAGASIVHAHSQIFATAFIPPNLQDKSEKILAYRLRHGTCVYCDVLKREQKGPRFVHKENGIVAFTPYASTHNYEIWIVPERHVDNITQVTPTERVAWARILKKTLTAITAIGLPYNYYFHEVVFDENQHLYMKITPRGSVWAGVEIGSGIIINPIAPEEAARYFRRAFTK